ncbi:MAG: choice-of-anchor tandem repeat GloVer-containing protein, partial [Capsulimonadaceae bacterium]
MHTHTTVTSRVEPRRLTLRTHALLPLGIALTIACTVVSGVTAVEAAARMGPPAITVGAIASATRLGPTPASQEVKLSLVLPLRNTDQLQTLLHRLYDPGDSLYHHFLTSQQFTAQFGPTEDRVTGVEAAAQAEGFRVLDASPNNTIIHVQATASTVNAAFQVTLYNYVGSDGASFISCTSPVVPTALAVNQVSVVGLDGSARLQHFMHVVGEHAVAGGSNSATPSPLAGRAGEGSNSATPSPLAGRAGEGSKSATPSPLAGRAGEGSKLAPSPALDWADVGVGPAPQTLKYYSGDGLLPSDVYSIYDWSKPSTGAGQNVALFELSTWAPTDICDWESSVLLGASSLTPHAVVVDGSSNDPLVPDAAIEATLDIDMVLLMAPGISNLYVYEAPIDGDQTQEALDIYNKMATDNTARVISTSWGFSEVDWIPYIDQFVVDEGQIFEQFAAQGQTLCVAAGDTGAYSDDFDFIPNVGLEAAMPYVLSVGGTDLTDGPGETYVSETSWADPGDTTRGPLGTGGGGGISGYWPIPGYQIGAFDPTINTQGSLSNRNLPDVSLFADFDDNGYEILWTDVCGSLGPAGTQYKLDVNGTSAATPLWGGLLAAVNAGRASAGLSGLGFANPAIYSLAEEPAAYANDFHDIDDGSTNMFYKAVAGYDNSTGWGSFQGDHIYTDLLTYGTGAPHSPVDVTAAAANSEVSLSWTASTWATTYNIYRGTASAGEGSTAIASITGNTFTDTGLTNGTTYYYEVTALNLSGHSAQSSEVSATPESALPPRAPAALIASSGVSQVSLTWTASASAAGYDVYRGTALGAETEIVNNTAPTTYLDTRVANGVTYYYYVTAVSGEGTSTASNIASGTPGPLPTSPANLTATTSSSAILLSWSGDSNTTSFNIYEGTASGRENTAPLESTYNSTILITGLKNLEYYYFRVAGVNASGTGKISNEASSEPMLETIPHHYDPGVEGIEPSGLIQAASGDFYGMTSFGGESVADGSVYEIDPAGDVGVLYAFNGGQPSSWGVSQGDLVFGPDGNLYGMTANGGSTIGLGPGGLGYGDIFRVTPAGVGTTLHSFNDGSVPNDGQIPMCGLVLASDGNFYGTTSFGGSNGFGTVFRMTTTGMVTILHSFADGSVANDGHYPYAALIQASDGNLYGTTAEGGADNDGTVFRITTAGVEAILHNFGDGTTPNDGALPQAALLQASDGFLYGTTWIRGTGDGGTAFRIDTSGNMTVLHEFGDGTVAFDGAGPQAALIQATDGNFYGTAGGGGYTGGGAVFRMDSSGRVTILHAFTDGSVFEDGAWPWQPLVQGADGALYGVTEACFDGFSDLGNTFFRIDADMNSTSTPATPSGLAAIAGNAQVSLFWSESAGATSYSVYRATSSGGEGSIPVDTASVPTYTDTGLTNGVTYFYTVSAAGGSGTSPQSNEEPGTPESSILPAPAGLSASAGNAAVSLSWTASTAASSYNVYRSTVSGAEGATAIGTSPGASYTDTGLTNGVTYFYTVSAIDAAGTSPQSREVSTTPTSSLPAAPTSLTASAGNALVSLSWTAGAGATSYNIYRATASGAEGSAAAGATAVTSYLDTGLTNGVKCYYTVDAVGGAGTSVASNEASATPEPSAPPAPTGFSATAGDSQVSLFWTASLGATSYRIFRATASGAEGSTPAGAANLPTYIDTGLTNGVTYYYTVAAVNGVGTSPQSAEASTTPESTILPAPAGLTATAGNARVTLSWMANSAATSYNVYRATASGAEGAGAVGTSTSASYSDTGLTGGVTYYYSVSAVDAAGTSPQSNEAYATAELLLPSAPAGLSATSSSGAIILSWTGDGSATSYSIYVGTASGAESGVPVASTTRSGVLVTGMTNMQTTYFEVAGVNALGTGPRSNEASNHPVEESILHVFDTGSVLHDGAIPNSGLVQDTNGSFYGTTVQGGSAGTGTVFQVDPSGVLTILHSFEDGSVSNDGSYPTPSLTLASDGNFYGTTSTGGSTGTGTNGYGTVYRMTPGGDVTILHNFGDGSVSSDGRYPAGGLVQASDGNLYGTTETGGTKGSGTVFRITLSGTETVLYSFGETASDGYLPWAGLIQASDGKLYGTTLWGGPKSNGAVFRITTSGAYSLLYGFGTSPDGSLPSTALVQGADGDFYGTTILGGSGNAGTVFRMDTTGNVTILHNFDDGTVPLDGQNPATALIQATDGDFYGVTFRSGWGSGAAFRMDTSGNVTILHEFGDGSVTGDGLYIFDNAYQPPAVGPLVQGYDGFLYGATSGGGSANIGTVFRLDAGLSALPAPPAPAAPTGLAATAGNGSVTLSWSPSAGGPSYDVYDGTATGREGVVPVVTGISGTAVTVAGLANGTTYYFTVAAVNAGSTSAPSNEASATPELPAPAGLSATSSSGAILLSWSRTPGATAYTIYAGTSAGAEGNSPVQSTTQTFGLVTGLVNGETYYFKVAAATSTGTGALSSEASGVPIAETIVHNFGDGTVANDGLYPNSALIPATGGGYYGVAEFGGAANEGAVYEIDIAGSETILHSFGDGTVVNDGVFPNWVIAASDGNLYGTTYGGGSTGYGTVYRITPAGATTILHSFGDGSVANDGDYPEAALMQASDGNLYGTTSGGGSVGSGAAFRITLSGATTILHSFADGSVADDGIYPAGSFIQGSDGNLYGTTCYGGKSAGNGQAGDGTAFRMTTSGEETLLHSFGDGTVPNDGSVPGYALLQAADGYFYGTTCYGGSSGYGTAFRMDSSGNETILHHFGDGTVPVDGLFPWANLTQAGDGDFYGTTVDSVSTAQFNVYWNGAVYRMDSSGHVTTLHVFGDGSVTNDGVYPAFALVQGQYGALYGTSVYGGDADMGTVFQLDTGLVPVAPSGLTATAGNSRVVLAWSASRSATSYNVYRGTAAGGESATPAATGVTTTGYTDTGLTNGLSYYYKVAAVDAGGTSALSNEASGTPKPLVPPAPTGLTAASGNAQVSLTWTASSGATSYSIYRATASGAEGSTPIGAATSTSYANTGLTNGVKYFYTVAAVNSAGTSAQSGEVSTTLAPNAPTGVTAAGGNAEVGLSWTSSYAATTYAIYRGTTSGGESSTPVASATGLSYADSGLTNGVRYYYKVAAVNAGGTSTLSTEVSATPEPPAPVTPAGLTATAGNGQVALSWTASTGATSYKVYRGTTSGGEASTAIGTASTTAYTDTGLTNFVTYFYKVAAVNGGGISALSNEASAMPAPPLSPTHVLWSNPNGSLSLWNYNPATGSYTQYTYGPFATWSPTAIADGPDGMTRVLWVCTTGAAAIWSVNTSTGVYTQYVFGPYPGWTASAATVSPSNVTHVLWSTPGSASIWNYNTGTGAYTQN